MKQVLIRRLDQDVPINILLYRLIEEDEHSFRVVDKDGNEEGYSKNVYEYKVMFSDYSEDADSYVNTEEIESEEQHLELANPIQMQVDGHTIVPQIFEHIQKVHKEVSQMKTPKGAIKKRPDGLDYVELGYMKNVADVCYPGWSWEIISFQFVGDQAITVHGRLTYFDGMKRIGDMLAGHRIQKKRDDKTKYVDIGNDCKSANTDTLKKAFNTYMNISDDVYKKTGEYLSDEQINELYDIASEGGRIITMALKNKFENNDIEISNYDEVKKALIEKVEKIKAKKS